MRSPPPSFPVAAPATAVAANSTTAPSRMAGALIRTPPARRRWDPRGFARELCEKVGAAHCDQCANRPRTDRMPRSEGSAGGATKRPPEASRSSWYARRRPRARLRSNGLALSGYHCALPGDDPRLDFELLPDLTLRARGIRWNVRRGTAPHTRWGCGEVRPSGPGMRFRNPPRNLPPSGSASYARLSPLDKLQFRNAALVGVVPQTTSCLAPPNPRTRPPVASMQAGHRVEVIHGDAAA